METVKENQIAEASLEEKKQIIVKVCEKYKDATGAVPWKKVFKDDPSLRYRLGADKDMQKVYGLKSLISKKQSLKSKTPRKKERKARYSYHKPSEVNIEETHYQTNGDGENQLTQQLNFCPHCGFDLNKLAKLAQLAEKLGVH